MKASFAKLSISRNVLVAKEKKTGLSVIDKYFQPFHGQVVSTTADHKQGQYVFIDDLLLKNEDNENLFNCYITLTYVP